MRKFESTLQPAAVCNFLANQNQGCEVHRTDLDDNSRIKTVSNQLGTWTPQTLWPHGQQPPGQR